MPALEALDSYTILSTHERHALFGPQLRAVLTCQILSTLGVTIGRTDTPRRAFCPLSPGLPGRGFLLSGLAFVLTLCS